MTRQRTGAYLRSLLTFYQKAREDFGSSQAFITYPCGEVNSTLKIWNTEWFMCKLHNFWKGNYIELLIDKFCFSLL